MLQPVRVFKAAGIWCWLCVEHEVTPPVSNAFHPRDWVNPWQVALADAVRHYSCYHYQAAPADTEDF
jgi:hypothetical protein